MLNSQTLAQTLLELSRSENADAQTKQFFVYLKEKNLHGLLPQIKAQVIRLQQKADDFNTLAISSAYKLSDREIEEIITITGAPTDVRVSTEIDPSIIGSFSARFQGKMYDGSLSNALSQMNKALNV